MQEIVIALMAGIKLASYEVNELYGKSSFRENEKDDRGTKESHKPKQCSQKINTKEKGAKEKIVAPGYANQ